MAPKWPLPEDEEEVEIAEFKWRDHGIRWEKFLKIDWDDKQNRFNHSGIVDRLSQKRVL